MNEVLFVDEFAELRENCSQYLSQYGYFSLSKTLPSMKNVQRVKIRQRNRSDANSEIINRAFAHLSYDLSNRSILCNTASTHPTHYVYPVNGFRIIHNEQIGDLDKTLDGMKYASDLLGVSYVNGGVLPNAEVIVYGIPAYYVVECKYAHKHLGSVF